MGRVLLKKTAYSLAVLAGVVLVVFLLFNVLPADPARLMQGQRSDVASLEAVRKEFGLDLPLHRQLLLYLSDLSPISVEQDTKEEQERYRYMKLLPFGAKALVLKKPYLRRSYQTRRLVSEVLAETLPNTAVLALGSMLIATILGILLGVLSALTKDSIVDRLALSISIIGISLPSFFAAILIAWLFGFIWSQYTGLNMSGSLYDYDPFSGEVIVWKNVILPAITLGIRPLAAITQFTRTSMLDVLQQDYIRTARAKGLSTPVVVFRHALKNALNPVITAISGWMASLMAGAFFVEYIFGWNGLGKVMVDALDCSDLPVIMGSVLAVALIFIVINIVVDVLYTMLDPRIRI